MSSFSTMDSDWEPLTDEEIKQIVPSDSSNFKSQSADVEPVDWSNLTYQSELSWFVDPRRFKDQCNPKMFHDGLPHEGPMLHVDERLPAKLEHIRDSDEVLDIAKQLGFPDAHEMELVVKVVMNDLSSIYIPFRGTSGHEYLSFLAKQVPRMKEWLAQVYNCEVEDVNTEYDKTVRKYKEQHTAWLDSLSPDVEVKEGLEHFGSESDGEPEVRSLDINSESDADFSVDDTESSDESDDEDYDWMDW